MSYSPGCSTPSFCDQLCAQGYWVGPASGTLVVAPQRRGAPVDGCPCTPPTVVSGAVGSSSISMRLPSSTAGEISVTLAAAASGRSVLAASVPGTSCVMTYAVASGTVLGVRAGASAAAPITLALTGTAPDCSRYPSSLSDCDRSCSSSLVYESFAVSATETLGALIAGSATMPVERCRCFSPLIRSVTSGGFSGVFTEYGTSFSIRPTGGEGGAVISFPDLPGCSLTYASISGGSMRWPTAVGDALAPAGGNNAPAAASAAGPQSGAIGGAVGGVLLLVGAAAALVYRRRAGRSGGGGGPVKPAAGAPDAPDAPDSGAQPQLDFSTANPMAHNHSARSAALPAPPRRNSPAP